MNPKTTSSPLPIVDFSTLQRLVLETKSASTARYYLAMLKRLQTYNKSSVLDLSIIDSDYVANFGEYLVRDGVTQSTVKLFKMAFRAIMKDVFGTDFKVQFKAAFKEVDSKNETATHCISYEDLQKIINCNLENNLVLKRAKLAFIYCLVSGGLSLQGLKSQIRCGKFEHELPQQKMVIREFESISKRSFEQYIVSLSDNHYTLALKQIAISSGISIPLMPRSATDGWISAAKKANLPPIIIASVLPSDSSFSINIGKTQHISNDTKVKALTIAANNVIDMKHRWYVMNCNKTDVADIDKAIKRAGILSDDDYFESFTLSKTATHQRKSSTKKSILDQLYFFNCKSSTAVAIRKVIREYAWVYTLAGTTIPAHIPDKEMKTFMLLCDVSEGTIAYHFPDTLSNIEEITIGQTAKIINGSFSGLVGVIKELPNNKYKVVMSFTSICAKVTAEVPLDFLQFS